MTWKEVKLATLQKMFAADGTEIPNDESTKEYVAGMPGAANEALAMLCTAGKFLVKSIQIEHERKEKITECRYDLKELAEDFYSLSENQIFYENADGDYRVVTRYSRESQSKVVLTDNSTGTYTVYYNAYPPRITIATEEDYELPLAPEVVVLLPLYMASQLYKDDDNGIATSYRNEFEVAFERLMDDSRQPGKESWQSESGWI